MGARRVLHTKLLGATAAAAVIVVAVGGCGADGAEQQDSPVGTQTASPSVRYPGVHNDWDVSTGIPQAETEAARFAAETAAMLAQGRSDIGAARAVRSRISPRLDEWPSDLNTIRQTRNHTGGELFRAVSATPIGAGSAHNVTICIYPTPGEYAVSPDGGLERLSGTGAFWFAFDSTVQLTTEPAADGSASEIPRRLLVDSGRAGSSTQERADQQALCDKYAPDPLVQHPPAPLPPK